MFPFAEASLGIQLQRAEASVASDKTHILNAMIGSTDFNASLPDHHAMYDYLNEMLRARFAMGCFRAAVEDAHCPDGAVTRYRANINPLAGLGASKGSQFMDSTCTHCGQAVERHSQTSLLGRFCTTLGNGHMREILLDLDCDCFTVDVARQLGHALGHARELERVTLNFNDSDDVLMTEMVTEMSVFEEALPACRALDIHNNNIGDAGFEALAKLLASGGLPKCQARLAPDRPWIDMLCAD